ncbi:hypothetical protein R3W88_000132 [Solanum pinnatisectum]|uniref:Uncharacterized protein n=1 Tax=Solanum pinnatisectum TaxID=50273 RepID=A0AAV9MEI2_9SOLN|nr:hypothetical protein R3W88_000132 [Solanum pinnatisectum]
MDDYPSRGWKFHPTNLDLLHILHDHLYTVNIREMFDTLVGDPSEPNTKFVLVKEPTKACSSQIDRNAGDFYWKNTGVPQPDEAMMKFNMVVYSLNPSAPIPLQHKNVVLCKLTKTVL